MMGTAILKSPWDCWICFVAERAAKAKGRVVLLRDVSPPGSVRRDYLECLQEIHRPLHDVAFTTFRAFVPTIRNFINFILSTLTTNGPEELCGSCFDGFYNDDRTAEKLIVNPIAYHGDCCRRHDEYMLSYVPRELFAGRLRHRHLSGACDRKQPSALMKADYMLALNSWDTTSAAASSAGKVLHAEERRPRFVLRRGLSPRSWLHLSAIWHGGSSKGTGKGRPQGEGQADCLFQDHEGYAGGELSLREDARRAKDHVARPALRRRRAARISLFLRSYLNKDLTAQVYEYCRIARVSKPRGRPPKAKAGGAA